MLLFSGQAALVLTLRMQIPPSGSRRPTAGRLRLFFSTDGPVGADFVAALAPDACLSIDDGLAIDKGNCGNRADEDAVVAPHAQRGGYMRRQRCGGNAQHYRDDKTGGNKQFLHRGLHLKITFWKQAGWAFFLAFCP